MLYAGVIVAVLAAAGFSQTNSQQLYYQRPIARPVWNPWMSFSPGSRYTAPPGYYVIPARPNLLPVPQPQQSFQQTPVTAQRPQQINNNHQITPANQQRPLQHNNNQSHQQIPTKPTTPEQANPITTVSSAKPEQSQTTLDHPTIHSPPQTNSPARESGSPPAVQQDQLQNVQGTHGFSQILHPEQHQQPNSDSETQVNVLQDPANGLEHTAAQELMPTALVVPQAPVDPSPQDYSPPVPNFASPPTTEPESQALELQAPAPQPPGSQAPEPQASRTTDTAPQTPAPQPPAPQSPAPQSHFIQAPGPQNQSSQPPRRPQATLLSNGQRPGQFSQNPQIGQFPQFGQQPLFNL